MEKPFPGYKSLILWKEAKSPTLVAKEIDYINGKDYLVFDNQRAKVSYLLFKYTSRIKES